MATSLLLVPLLCRLPLVGEITALREYFSQPLVQHALGT